MPIHENLLFKNFKRITKLLKFFAGFLTFVSCLLSLGLGELYSGFYDVEFLPSHACFLPHFL